MGFASNFDCMRGTGLLLQGHDLRLGAAEHSALACAPHLHLHSYLHRQTAPGSNKCQPDHVPESTATCRTIHIIRVSGTNGAGMAIRAGWYTVGVDIPVAIGLSSINQFLSFFLIFYASQAYSRFMAQ